MTLRQLKSERTTRKVAKWFRRLYKLVLLDVFLILKDQCLQSCLYDRNTRAGTRTVIRMYKTCLKTLYCSSRNMRHFQKIKIYKTQLDNRSTVLNYLTRCLHISYRSRCSLVSLFWYYILLPVSGPRLLAPYSWQVCNCNNATSLKRKHLR